MAKKEKADNTLVYKVGGHLTGDIEFFAGDPVPSDLSKIDRDALEEMEVIVTRDEYNILKDSEE